MCICITYIHACIQCINKIRLLFFIAISYVHLNEGGRFCIQCEFSYYQIRSKLAALNFPTGLTALLGCSRIARRLSIQSCSLKQAAEAMRCVMRACRAKLVSSQLGIILLQCKISYTVHFVSHYKNGIFTKKETSQTHYVIYFWNQ